MGLQDRHDSEHAGQPVALAGRTVARRRRSWRRRIDDEVAVALRGRQVDVDRRLDGVRTDARAPRRWRSPRAARPGHRGRSSSRAGRASATGRRRRPASGPAGTPPGRSCRRGRSDSVAPGRPRSTRCRSPRPWPGCRRSARRRWHGHPRSALADGLGASGSAAQPSPRGRGSRHRSPDLGLAVRARAPGRSRRTPTSARRRRGPDPDQLDRADRTQIDAGRRGAHRSRAAGPAAMRASQATGSRVEVGRAEA